MHRPKHPPDAKLDALVADAFRASKPLAVQKRLDKTAINEYLRDVPKQERAARVREATIRVLESTPEVAAVRDSGMSADAYWASTPKAKRPERLRRSHAANRNT